MTHRPKSNKRKNLELSRFIPSPLLPHIFNRRLKLLPRDYWREQFACNLQNRPLNRTSKNPKRKRKKRKRSSPSVPRFVSSFLSLIQTRLSPTDFPSSRYSIGPRARCSSRATHGAISFHAVLPFWIRILENAVTV